jgi:membrane-associated phospholipid phosphatase
MRSAVELAAVDFSERALANKKHGECICKVGSSSLHYGTAMRKSILVLVALAGFASLLATGSCRAEDFNAEDFTAKNVLEDAKLYVTAPLRWDVNDWLYFGGALAAVGAAHAFDGDVRRHFAVGERAVLNGQDKDSVRDAIPAAAVVAGTWAVAALIGDRAGEIESYTMLEAAGFSLVTAEGLKFAAGRERPDETTHVNEWRDSGTSFPSFHATAAFAVGTVLAESGGDDYRWIRRILGYGMATATAYARLHANAHWLSDTVAGAAVGVATARFAMNRREERKQRWDLSIAPMAGGGTELTWTMNLN